MPTACQFFRIYADEIEDAAKQCEAAMKKLASAVDDYLTIME